MDSVKEKANLSLNNYFKFLNFAMQIYMIQIIISNIVFQLRAIVEPMEKSNQVVVNVGYTVASVVTLILFTLTVIIKDEKISHNILWYCGMTI